MIYEVSASDLLLLDDAVFSNIQAETLEDTLGFSESVFSNFKYSSASDSVAFDDYAVPGTTLYLGITDTLTFTDATAPRVLVVSASDFLFLWDVLSQPIAGVIRDSFVLSDEVVCENSYLLTPDVVTFTDSVSLVFLPNKSLTESVAFSDAVSSVRINALTPYLPQ